MKFAATAIAFAASLAFVSAQDLSGIPTCAIPCFAAALPGSGCSATDTVCQCTTGKDYIANSITSCAPTKCDTNDVNSLAPAVQSICLKAGITVTSIPQTTQIAASGSSAASATATKSASSSATKSASATSSGAAKATGAASMHGAGMGAVAFGFAAVLAL